MEQESKMIIEDLAGIAAQSFTNLEVSIDKRFDQVDRRLDILWSKASLILNYA